MMETWPKLKSSKTSSIKQKLELTDELPVETTDIQRGADWAPVP